MTENQNRLVSKLSGKADGLILLSYVNRSYITSFSSSDGYCIVKPDEIVFITDFRYYESACIKQQKGLIDKDIKLVLQGKNVWMQIKEIVSGCKKLMFEENHVSVAMYENMKKTFSDKELVTGASQLLSECRSIKTSYELSLIKKAQSITDKTYTYMLSFISDNVGKPDFTEKNLALELEYFMYKNGADTKAFDTIAVSGKKSSLPHGTPEDVPVSKGFLTMDFGARYCGYCSDMTRTISIGKPDDEMLKVYNTVLDAQKAAFEKICADVVGKEPDLAARAVIDGAGYAGTFGHSLGHSLGLEIHESPNFASGVETAIPENVVISVEPGIYLEGKFGVRIEDIVCVKQGGFENLTHSPKELIVI